LDDRKLLLLVLNQRLHGSHLITKEEFNMMQAGIIAMETENTGISQIEEG